LVVWNRSKHKLAPLAELGARIAESPAQLMQGCEVIGLCLTSHHAVDEVCCGSGGLLSEAESRQAPRPAAIVDFSTGSPEAASANGRPCTGARHRVGRRARQRRAARGGHRRADGARGRRASAALQAASPLLHAVAARTSRTWGRPAAGRWPSCATS
jgi:hypothetical protein